MAESYEDSFVIEGADLCENWGEIEFSGADFREKSKEEPFVLDQSKIPNRMLKEDSVKLLKYF